MQSLDTHGLQPQSNRSMQLPTLKKLCHGVMVKDVATHKMHQTRSMQTGHHTIGTIFFVRLTLVQNSHIWKYHIVRWTPPSNDMLQAMAKALATYNTNILTRGQSEPFITSYIGMDVGLHPSSLLAFQLPWYNTWLLPSRGWHRDRPMTFDFA